MSRKIVRIFGKFDDYRIAEQNEELYINVIPYYNTDWKGETVNLICEVNKWRSDIDGIMDNFGKQVISTLESHNIKIISVNEDINHRMKMDIIVDRISFEPIAIIAKTKQSFV